MASSLIDLLNKHGDKTPDEITTQLKIRGWIYLADISPQDHAYLMNRQCVLISHHAERRNPWHMIQSASSSWNFWFDLNYCCEVWVGTWACRVEEYENGHFPDPTPEQTRR